MMKTPMVSIPPEKRIVITLDVIGVSEVDAYLREAEGGAVCVFVGTTRRITDGRETIELSYEAAETLARAEIERMVADAADSWQLLRVAVFHRTGTVPVGEASVVIGVASAHRDEAFGACRFLIDELKERVPIWKKEHFSDGSSEWVRGTLPDAD